RAHYRGPTGERDLRVRACTDLAKAVLFTTSPLLMNAHDRETFGRVEKTVRLSRYGGPCHAHCMLRAGPVDLALETAHTSSARHRRRRRAHSHLGARRPARGRAHHRGRR